MSGPGHIIYGSVLVMVLLGSLVLVQKGCNAQDTGVSTAVGPWQIAPTRSNSWSLYHRLPMTTAISSDESDDVLGRGKGGFKVKKKYKKYMLPLLLAYKLKFFAAIPVMIGMLLLLTGTTGMAGFFFALFAASMGLNKN